MLMTAPTPRATKSGTAAYARCIGATTLSATMSSILLMSDWARGAVAPKCIVYDDHGDVRVGVNHPRRLNAAERRATISCYGC
jgi:hypothetical protein